MKKDKDSSKKESKKAQFSRRLDETVGFTMDCMEEAKSDEEINAAARSFESAFRGLLEEFSQEEIDEMVMDGVSSAFRKDFDELKEYGSLKFWSKLLNDVDAVAGQYQFDGTRFERMLDECLKDCNPRVLKVASGAIARHLKNHCRHEVYDMVLAKVQKGCKFKDDEDFKEIHELVRFRSVMAPPDKEALFSEEKRLAHELGADLEELLRYAPMEYWQSFTQKHADRLEEAEPNDLVMSAICQGEASVVPAMYAQFCARYLALRELQHGALVSFRSGSSEEHVDKFADELAKIAFDRFMVNLISHPV